MSRVFITGSSAGLGLMTSQLLIEQGHEVVVHARNAERAAQVKVTLPKAFGVVSGDLSRISEVRAVADQANALSPFDAVIHNAGVGFRERHEVTEDGLPHVFTINVLASYMLTGLIKRPSRLVYLSSAMQFGASARLDDATWKRRTWHAAEAYSESKLYDVMLALAAARLWRDVAANVLTPGWVPTRMGGAGAPDDINQACLTQIWLSTAPEAAQITGGYYYHLRREEPNPEAKIVANQARLIELCQKISGVTWPA